MKPVQRTKIQISWPLWKAAGIGLLLDNISPLVHRPFTEIIRSLPESVLKPVPDFQGFLDLMDLDSLADPEMKLAFI